MSKMRIFGLIVIIVGAIILLSPKIMNEVRDYQMIEKINEFIKDTQDIAENLDESDETTKTEVRPINKEAILNELKEYNENLYKNGQHIVDAFSYQDVSINLRKYRT